MTATNEGEIGSQGAQESLRGSETEKVSKAVRWATVIQEGLRGSCLSFGVS